MVRAMSNWREQIAADEDSKFNHYASEIRARICEGLGFLGVRLDTSANASNAPVISAADAFVHVRVIPTDEELMIARTVFRLTEGQHP